MIWPIDREQLITRPPVYKKSEVWSLCISQFQLRQPPHPRATAWHLPALSIPGVEHLQILRCPGAGYLPTPRLFQSFWHVRGFLSEYNYTEDFTGKTSILAHLSRTGKNWRGLLRHVLDFMHAFLQCLSSQNYTAKSGAVDVNQSFFVTWVKFLLILHVFEEHPFIFTV